MKEKLLLILFSMILPPMAIAQETPAVEIFGGYCFFHQGSSEIVNMPNEFNMHGWNASVAVNVNKWMGFVADLGGVYKVRSYDRLGTENHSFMFGSKFAARKAKITPFAQILFGVMQENVTGAGFGYEYANQSNFAMAFGGGLDIKAGDILAIRSIQFEYFRVRAGGAEFLNNLRYSAGVVFKLGKR
jgi:hypothetical protein